MFILVNDFRKKKYWGWTTDNRESTSRRKVQIVIDLKIEILLDLGIASHRKQAEINI